MWRATRNHSRDVLVPNSYQCCWIKHTGQIITKPLRCRKAIEKIHLKFIDDMTIAEAIDLKKKKLVPNPNPNPERPLTYPKKNWPYHG